MRNQREVIVWLITGQLQSWGGGAPCWSVEAHYTKDAAERRCKALDEAARSLPGSADHQAFIAGRITFEELQRRMREYGIKVGDRQIKPNAIYQCEEVLLRKPEGEESADQA